MKSGLPPAEKTAHRHKLARRSDTKRAKTATGAAGAKANSASAPALHPRNRHQGEYDFTELTRQSPVLSAFVIETPFGKTSIDFANPAAVQALNRALLKAHYGINAWTIPNGYLCPPIPGRADYLHGLADLLASDHGESIPRGAGVRLLDIGVGANCIYPLLGQAEYGWRFVGSDTDPEAIKAAQAIIVANPGLDQRIELRLQQQRERIFAGVLRADEAFDVCLSNPPFHASAQEAAAANHKKWRNLGKPARQRNPSALNFGGQESELWCPGGEVAFVTAMIEESAELKSRFCWFSSLVSKSDNLPGLRKALQQAGAVEVREQAMAQGNKQSRFIAWTFLDKTQRQERGRQRWR